MCTLHYSTLYCECECKVLSTVSFGKPLFVECLFTVEHGCPDVPYGRAKLCVPINSQEPNVLRKHAARQALHDSMVIKNT